MRPIIPPARATGPVVHQARRRLPSSGIVEVDHRIVRDGFQGESDTRAARDAEKRERDAEGRQGRGAHLAHDA
jgi:hypothetical protein